MSAQIGTGVGKRFLSEAEVEAEYGINRRSLQKWRLFNAGPRCRKFGTSVRYSRVELEEWISTLPCIGGRPVGAA
jgi:predicted DNA-binding transcriptional regulator AlpA